MRKYKSQHNPAFVQSPIGKFLSDPHKKNMNRRKHLPTPLNPVRNIPHGVWYYLLLRNHPHNRCLPAWKTACTVYKNYQLKNHLISRSSTGKALCLLKTQYAKKPKNPV